MTCFALVVAALSALAFRTDGADTVGATQSAATRFLSASAAAEREFARRQLLIQGPRSLPVFLAATASDDAALRADALRAIGSLGSACEPLYRPQLEAVLERATCDADPRVRAEASMAIASIGAPSRSQGVLAGALDEDWAVRRATAHALARCTLPFAIDSLFSLARDADPDVRRAAHDSLLLREGAAVDHFLRDEFLFADESLRRRIVERIADSRTPGLESFLEDVLLRCEDPFEVAAAASGLAKRGVNLAANAGRGVVLRCSLANEPIVHRFAYLAMLPRRAEFSRLLLALLDEPPRLDVPVLETAAHLVVDLLGPEAFAPLLERANGAVSVAFPSRVAAVQALRRFRDERTLKELSWVYAPEQPRALREALLSAFEDQPFTAGARSGLIQALADPDSGMRIRAFASLLRYGAEDDVEMGSLLRRIAREKDADVRGRMTRLVAEHARGAGARTFVATYAPRVFAEGATRREALDALENVPESGLSHEVASRLVIEARDEFDASLLRLLTRLRGDAADRAVAKAISRAISARDVVTLEELTFALRHGGGERSLAALERLLDDPDPRLATEALRTLLKHDRIAAIHVLGSRFAALDSDLRGELLEILDAAETNTVTALFEKLLAETTDIPTRLLLLTRLGELRLPLVPLLAELVGRDPVFEVRLRAADALASVGGDVARSCLGIAFVTALNGLDFAAADVADRCAEVETLARCLARLGATEHADRIAATLFVFYSQRVSSNHAYDTVGGFAFEETMLAALVETGAVANDSATTARSLSTTLERLEAEGHFARIPDDLLLRLGDALASAGDEYLPARERLYTAALAVPPSVDRREVKAMIDLAGVSTKSLDPAAAARWLDAAARAVDLFAIDRAERSVVVALGTARAVTGFEPLRRLRARGALARSEDAKLRGDLAVARAELREASRLAPDDCALAIDFAAAGIGLIEASLLRRELALVLERAPTQADLLTRVVEVAALLPDTALVAHGHQAIETLTRCGLVEESADRRLRLARARARLGDVAIAKAEVRRALDLDPKLRSAVRADPLLGGMLDDLLGG